MEQKSEPTTKELESQIRGMILGNVRMGAGQTHQDSQQNQRGRGRGRGGFSRGTQRGNFQQQGHQHQGQQQQGQQQQGPTPQGPNLVQRGMSTTRQQNARYPRQHPQHQGPTAAQPRAQAQGVLQRPAPVQGQANHSIPPHLRQSAPYQPRPQFNQPRENPMAQVEHLDKLAAEEIPKVEMSLPEFEEKEAFRQRLEDVLRRAFDQDYSGDIATISLVGFGSLASGFAMPGSDMDLAVVAGWKDSSQAEKTGVDRSIPRLLEKAVLDAKMGGRLLTRTRVPILKVCEKPTETLYTALFEERKKWDELPEEEQYPTDAPAEPSPAPKSLVDVDVQKSADAIHHADSPTFGDNFPELGAAPIKKKAPPKSIPEEAEVTRTEAPTALTKPVEAATPSDPKSNNVPNVQSSDGAPSDAITKDAPSVDGTKAAPSEITKDAPSVDGTKAAPSNEGTTAAPNSKAQQHPNHRNEKNWAREKVLGPLDFPKQGVGIQCDINFDNPLGIHNTHMLRCYSMTDPRVRPIVLFVKSWAKRRKINSAYSGTLNSYGWVLMVLHYLVNIAQPSVCPNLQHSIPQPKDAAQLANFFKDPTVSGYTVRFWRNEQEIIQAAQSGKLSLNKESIGALLRGFFQYYAGLSGWGSNYGARRPQFYWTNEVLSLRTPGGIRSKQDKGWVSAKTTVTAEKKVTNRYLFAIEDPFELDHNVARTVTHRGIVAIRDEFRRAWRILDAIGKGMQPEGGIFDEVLEEKRPAPPKEVKKMGMEDVGVSEGVDGVQGITEGIGGL